jgi:choline kinase
MKSIILAAGQGTRMGKLTANKPKCMVEFLGKPLLHHLKDLLQRNQINDIVVLKGNNGEIIDYSNVRYIDVRSSKNMVETLFNASNEMNEDLIILYGDVLLDNSSLSELLNSTDDISVLIDSNWYEFYDIRFEGKPYIDAESCMINLDGNIINIGEKNPIKTNIEGQYIGAIKLTKAGCRIFLEFYNQLLGNYKNKIWIRNRYFEEMYMTDFLQGLINSGTKVKAIEHKNGWLEFDSISDLICYENLYKKNMLHEFITIQDSI